MPAATTPALTPPDEVADALARLDALSDENAMLSPWLSVNEVAEVTGAGLRTIRRWIADGRLPSVRVGGRSVRVHRDDLATIVQTRLPTEPAPKSVTIPHSRCTCPCREAAAAAESADQP